MDSLQEFQTAAHERGFVDMEECDDGFVLWLRQQTPDAATKTHHRICLDSQTNSATVVYWMNNLEKVVSKTFRSAAGLRAWLALDPHAYKS
jgi:hypothetical protein